MLHAQVNQATASWDVVLTNGNCEICVLKTYANELEAHLYADAINIKMIPQQKTLLDMLHKTQGVLKDILTAAGPIPATADEYLLAVRRAIKYIEIGKSKDSN